jgi:hypothetical protein
MGLHDGLVLHHLAIQPVHQQVDRGIQVLRHTLHVHRLARQAQVDLGLLSFVFFGEIVDREDHVGIDDLIEMAGDALQLVLYVFTDGRGYFEVVTTDGEIHTHSFDESAAAAARKECAWVPLLQGFAETDGRNLERFAVFGNRAACNDHTLFTEHFRDLAVG